MALKVNERSPEVAAMACEWPMLEALMAGTRAMRTASISSVQNDGFLPKWPGEDDDGYRARVNTATLFPAFRRTVSVMVGKPLSKPLTFSADTPVEIAGEHADPDDAAQPTLGWADNIDREGVTLHAFAAEMLAEALAFGIGGILVESPKALATDSRPATKAEQAAAGLRPYFVRVKHGQILGWRAELVNGARKLTQLRILESVSEPDGDFGDVAVDQVRVLTPGAWALYRRAPNTDEWSPYDAGRTALTEIPFVPLYGARTDFMTGASPLIDLAYLNVKHWQSQSDQDTILHVARVPILFAKGFQDTDTITVGASSAIKTPNDAADMKWVEHGGQAIDAGRESLAALEDQMIQAGAELLVKKPGDRSATEAASDAEANKSDLQRIAEGFEGALDQALKFMADYAGLPTGGNVSLYKGFGEAMLSDASAQLVLALEQAGVISTETAINELKRRGALGDDVDPEDERERVEAQGPALGSIPPMAHTPSGGADPGSVIPEAA